MISLVPSNFFVWRIIHIYIYMYKFVKTHWIFPKDGIVVSESAIGGNHEFKNI